MVKRNVDDGIAGGRTVVIEIKIPNGRNCLKCPAHSKKFGKHACLLYGAWLNTNTYRKKGDLYGWPSGENGYTLTQNIVMPAAQRWTRRCKNDT